MIRAFVAIALPDEVRDALEELQALLPLWRPVPGENLHLTLSFLGPISPEAVRDAHEALCGVSAEAFSVELSGAGLFGGARPHAVWAGVSPSAPLSQLQRRIDRRLRMVGLAPQARKFTPHVTLARPRNLPASDVARLAGAVAGAAGFRAGPFVVQEFALYRSHLAPGGAHYSEMARYALVSRD